MAEATGALRVLLVEDDLDVASGIGDYLGAHGVLVDFAYDAREARHLAQACPFDLFVLDVNLPGTDGITLCRELKTAMRLPQPAIFLTARGDLHDKLQGFAAGAVDYVVKPFAPAELLARVRALAGHLHSARGTQLHVGDYVLDLRGNALTRSGSRTQLLATGYTIVRLLMEMHPGSVSSAELREALWGESVPDSNPLRAHIWHVRRQLLIDLGAQPIATVRGVGYRFACD